jgi:hypothetical protein
MDAADADALLDSIVEESLAEITATAPKEPTLPAATAPDNEATRFLDSAVLFLAPRPDRDALLERLKARLAVGTGEAESMVGSSHLGAGRPEEV